MLFRQDDKKNIRIMFDNEIPRSCPICKSGDKALLFNQSFAAFSQKNVIEAYDVVTCNNCGFCYADGIPEQQAFDSYYRDMSKYEKPDIKLHESEYDINRFDQIVKYLNARNLNRNSHIVEIGCSMGLLLSLLKKNGYTNLYGIDPSPLCVRKVIEQYSIPAAASAISGLSSIIKKQVDMLIMVGVLEHIRDLDQTMEELGRVLKQDGKICIVVPDASQYINGKDAPFQEFSIEHINFFGPVSLTNLMRKYEFSKLNIEQELVEVNRNTITPVILSLFSKDKATKSSLTFDVETSANLKKYINISNEYEKTINLKIKDLVNENHPLIIWGTGTQTLRLLANTDLSRANITAFVDSNIKYQGNKLNNVQVISPDALKDHNEPILISTRVYQDEIEYQIKHILKLPNKIIKLY
jgi:SAM-dependent methyltransferase